MSNYILIAISDKLLPHISVLQKHDSTHFLCQNISLFAMITAGTYYGIYNNIDNLLQLSINDISSPTCITHKTYIITKL